MSSRCALMSVNLRPGAGSVGVNSSVSQRSFSRAVRSRRESLWQWKPPHLARRYPAAFRNMARLRYAENVRVQEHIDDVLHVNRPASKSILTADGDIVEVRCDVAHFRDINRTGDLIKAGDRIMSSNSRSPFLNGAVVEGYSYDHTDGYYKYGKVIWATPVDDVGHRCGGARFASRSTVNRALRVIGSVDDKYKRRPKKHVTIRTHDAMFDPIHLDIEGAYFGVQAGDIVCVKNRWASPGRGPALVEGYSYTYEYGSIALWIRSLRGGTLSEPVYCVSERNFDLEAYPLVEKRGDYDPKDYGLDPEARLHLWVPDVRHATLKPYQVARESGNSALEEAMPLEMAFQRFHTVLLKGELIDLLRRMNTLFPLARLEAVEREIQGCTSPRQVQRWEWSFFRNVGRYLKGDYSAEELEPIIAVVNDNRERVRFDELQKDALSWMRAALFHKIGIDVIEPFDVRGGTVAQRFPEAVNYVVQQVVNYLAPLYEDGVAWAQRAYDIFNRKPIYLRELLARHSDPVSAARHVVAVAMNAVSAMLERAYSYDFKHVVDQRKHSMVRPMGWPIFLRIVDRIKNPTGKQLPLASALMYFDGDIYTVYPFAPPSSSGKNVIRFEIATGCDWGRCTYCSLYENEPFSLTAEEAFERHVSFVKEYLGSWSMSHDFNRVFLSGGNGLSMPTERLIRILDHVKKQKGGTIRRIESYATTRALLYHREEGLARLCEHGLSLVYWGVESGNDDVLKMIRKGYAQKQVMAAGRALRGAGIMISAMVMPGVSGTRYLEGHERDTARVLGEILPQYVTFMGVHAPETAWERDIEEDPNNRSLTVEEMIDHQKAMRKLYKKNAMKNRLIHERSIVAAHGPDVTPASYNPLTFVEKN